jgi:hypothetical protein
MKKTFLTGIAALFLATTTGTAHAICGHHGVSCWQCGNTHVELSEYADRNSDSPHPGRSYYDLTAEVLPNPNALRFGKVQNGSRKAYLNGKLCKEIIDQ